MLMMKVVSHHKNLSYGVRTGPSSSKPVQEKHIGKMALSNVTSRLTKTSCHDCSSTTNFMESVLSLLSTVRQKPKTLTDDMVVTRPFNGFTDRITPSRNRKRYRRVWHQALTLKIICSERYRQQRHSMKLRQDRSHDLPHRRGAAR